MLIDKWKTAAHNEVQHAHHILALESAKRDLLELILVNGNCLELRCWVAN
jgi:hypothetical protein